MSFCQKHLNHHCHHAHNCQNPSHQQHKNSKEKKAKPDVAAHQQKKVKHQDKSCHFVGNSARNQHKEQKNAERHFQIEKNQAQLQKQMNAFQAQNQSLRTENKHLYSQIQYYRDQFATLIQNNTADTRNQIKKRLKQTTEMSLKIKQLQIENASLRNINEDLMKFIHDDKINRQQNKHINSDLQDKYEAIYHKLKVSDRQKQQLRASLQANSKELIRNEEKYALLKKQFNFQSEKYLKQSKDLSRELQQCKKELNKLKSSSQKEREISKLDKQAASQKQDLFKTKIKEYETNNTYLTNHVKELTLKVQQLSDDLDHAKVLIQKRALVGQQFNQLEKQMKEYTLQNKTVIKERKYESTNKQNKSDNQEKDQLRSEIILLKQKIVELEKHNSAHFQEIILSMGASEAFKRLVEQKNAVIKKLMRQKGQIMMANFNNRA